MISHKHKCIFIHIPKCAGTSIERSLNHHEYHAGRGRQDHRSLADIQKNAYDYNRLLGHEKLIHGKVRLQNVFRDIRGEPRLNVNNFNSVSRKQYLNYFKFTFVRNPWARAFSWYRNVMRDSQHRNRKKLNIDVSLLDFLNLEIGKGNLRPQTFWIVDLDGRISLDFIGRYEKLMHDFSHVANILGVSCELPHELKGDELDYRIEYDVKSKDLVWKHYKEEITMFEYEFDV